jgi:predicted dehydrogenase
MKALSASVIGGGMGGLLSMNALAASPRFDLVAACDINPEVCKSLEQRFQDIETYPTYQDLFRDRPTDVVCVSTWAPSHKEITLAALELPLKGILVEKPLGDTVTAARELLEAVKAKKLPMCVPHGLLVAPHSREILDRVRAGEIGELKLVEIECDKWDIINAGIHWFNFFVMLTGGEAMKYVIAQCDKSTRTYRDGMQVETFGVSYAETKSGARCVMNTGDYVTISREGKSFLFRIVGTEGAIEFWGWESAYRVLNAEFPSGRLFEVDPGERTRHQVHLETMAQHIDDGSPDYTFPDSSLAALELVEGAYLSARHGARVDLPLESFRVPPSSDWDPGRPYSGSDGGRDGRKLT